MNKSSLKRKEFLHANSLRQRIQTKHYQPIEKAGLVELILLNLLQYQTVVLAHDSHTAGQSPLD